MCFDNIGANRKAVSLCQLRLRRRFQSVVTVLKRDARRFSSEKRLTLSYPKRSSVYNTNIGTRDNRSSKSNQIFTSCTCLQLLVWLVDTPAARLGSSRQNATLGIASAPVCPSFLTTREFVTPIGNFSTNATK